MTRMKIVMVALLVALLAALSVTTFAQSRPALAEVWVTTQDFVTLRAGPGQTWQRLAVIPHSVTLRATGRTLEAKWIQVAYQGPLLADAPPESTIDGVTYGWIADWLLIWTGDILQLPVDGVSTLPYARRSGPVLATRYSYIGGVDPSTRVHADTVLGGEVTGRVGSVASGYFWLQFRSGDQYYWTGSWAAGVPSGYSRLPDGAYLYVYGRLLIQLRDEASRSNRVLNDIGNRWERLAGGSSTTCNNLPAPLAVRERSLLPGDVRAETIFAPAVRALLAANDALNMALTAFVDVCARQGADRFARADEVKAALENVRQARANLTLVNTLLPPLQRRDPLLGNTEPTLNTP